MAPWWTALTRPRSTWRSPQECAPPGCARRSEKRSPRTTRRQPPAHRWQPPSMTALAPKSPDLTGVGTLRVRPPPPAPMTALAQCGPRQAAGDGARRSELLTRRTTHRGTTDRALPPLAELGDLRWNRRCLVLAGLLHRRWGYNTPTWDSPP